MLKAMKKFSFFAAIVGALIAVSILASGWAEPDRADVQKQCEDETQNWPAEITRLELINPIPLTKSQKDRFLPGYLAGHPKPHPNTNTIYLIAMGPVVWAYFVSSSCITHVDEIPMSIVRGWMDSKEV